MLKRLQFKWTWSWAVLALLGAAQAVAQTSPPPLYVQSIPVGAKPMGVATLLVNTTYQHIGTAIPAIVIVSYAAVANSGDDSLSVFVFGFGTYNSSIATAIPLSTVHNIPSPYGVAGCLIPPGSQFSEPTLAFVATSPSRGSVFLVNASRTGEVLGSIQVGTLPYSVACSGNRAAVSNFGESSLSFVDMKADSKSVTFTETARVSGVPGSRSLHSVAISSTPSKRLQAWVAGTESNQVTVVDMDTATVLIKLPVQSPTAVFCCISGGVAVTSQANGTITIYDPSTFQVIQTIPNITKAQDISAFSSLGTIAIAGQESSLFQITNSGAIVIPGTSGATSLATGIPYLGGIYDRPFALATNPEANRIYFIQLPPLQGPPTPPRQSAFASSLTSLSGASLFAPGSAGSLFDGTGLDTSLGFNRTLVANSYPLPKTLGGISLNFGGTTGPDSTGTNWAYNPTGGVDAGLFSADYGHVLFQIPPGLRLGENVPAQFTTADGSTKIYTIHIVAASPRIYYYQANGKFSNPNILNEDSSLNLSTNPAARGSVIQIFGNGAGDTTPLLLPGEAAPASGNPFILTNVQPTVTIGGVAAPVQFSGMAPGFVGLWQINAQIPQEVQPGPEVPVVVTAGGVASNTVTIAVQ